SRDPQSLSHAGAAFPLSCRQGKITGMSYGRDRKRLIKAARKFSDNQIREFLGDGDYRLVHNRTLATWLIRHGDSREVTIEDDALHLACVEYMRDHGYPLFFDPVEQASVQTNPVNPSGLTPDTPPGSK